MASNYERLIKLAEEVFDFRNDPDQLNVDQKVMDRLTQIHPAALSEFNGENGPVAWLLVIPTTEGLMHKFLSKEISERELFEMTPVNGRYDALYLCSALVLKEYRRKGITRDLLITAIEGIKKDHPVRSLFVWAFSKEGDLAAEAISKTVGIPLYKLR